MSSCPVRGVVSSGSGPNAHARICATVVSTGVTLGSGTCFSACLKSFEAGAVGLQWQTPPPPHEIMQDSSVTARRSRLRFCSREADVMAVVALIEMLVARVQAACEGRESHVLIARPVWKAGSYVRLRRRGHRKPACLACSWNSPPNRPLRMRSSVFALIA